MIQLPLRLAASVPLGVVVVGAFIVAMTYADGRKLHPIYGTPNAALMAFFAGAVALVLVLPNVTAAYVANRGGGGSLLRFALLLGVVSVSALVAELHFLGKFMRVHDGLVNFADWRVYGVFALNVLTLLVTALVASARNA